MTSEDLPVEVERRVAELGTLDCLLVVLSFQHARTIPAVIRGLDKGLTTHFPEARAAIVHWDAGSTDGTTDAAARAAGALRVVSLSRAVVAGPRAMPPVYGVPGSEGAFRQICGIARLTGARALILVGADLRTVPDDWVERLLRPLWTDRLDLVTPLFARHVLDGTLTTCLLHPLTRALYGASVRQMIAAELGLSGSLLSRLCEAPGWGSGASRPLSLFLTTTAAALGARLGEVWLGAREEEPGEARLDLGGLMSEVVGAAFALAELQEEAWRERPPAPPPARLGEPALVASEPSAASQVRLVAVFRQGVRDLQPIWEQALSAATLGDVYALGDLAPEEFGFSGDLWARVVYDMLLAYRFRVLHRDHLLRSLVPLYLGRLAGLSREAAGLPAPRQERLLEAQARAFEREKPEFADRWR
jgi:hypothetical protein